MSLKKRLDILLVERQLAPSRSKAAAMIMAAEVKVDDRLIDKPGAMVSNDAMIRLKAKPRFVSRGGIKLEAALNAFAVDPTGTICADVGASTGGFTDCLLQHGAAKVYAIDVGSGLLDYRLRLDQRVVLLEKTNARHLESLPESPALVVIDVSFISLRLIFPAVRQWVGEGAKVIALVKPQFEAGKSEVGKGGIVRQPAVHRRVLRAVTAFAAANGFAMRDVIQSPITGAKGNVEFLLWLGLGHDAPAQADLQDRVNRVTEPSL